MSNVLFVKKQIGMDILTSNKYQVASYKFVNRKLKIRGIVIARSVTTKQSKFRFFVETQHFASNVPETPYIKETQDIASLRSKKI
jgi:hypothetical protein